MTDRRPSTAALPAFVIHYEAPEWCRATVASLLASAVPVQVTVIDNSASTVPAGFIRGTSVIDANGNRGYAGAANVAASLATGHEWFVVTSHDAIVPPDAFPQMLRAARLRPKVGVVGLGGETGRGAVLESVAPGVTRRTWVSGACLLVRSQCWRDVGGFDARLGSYVEDTDFCLRAIDAGWDVLRLDDLVLKMYGSASPRAATLTAANHVLLTYKREGARRAARSMTRLVVEGQFLAAWSVLTRVARFRRREIRHE